MDGRERGGKNKKERRALLFFSSQIFVLGLIFFIKKRLWFTIPLSTIENVLKRCYNRNYFGHKAKMAKMAEMAEMAKSGKKKTTS